jgi:hypothetical protein
MGLKKLNYESLEKARTQELDLRLQQTLESRFSGKIDSLKRTILAYVSEGDYDTAKSALDKYVEMQKEYPGFIQRGERYIQHCSDVIHSIKAKREMPGLHTLPMSKQQEVMETVLKHFEELKHYLHKLELIQKDVKIDDLRSTVWVIKAMAYSIFLVVCIFFIKSAAMGIWQSFEYLVEDFSSKAINWIFDLFE